MKEKFKLATYQISITAPISWNDEQAEHILNQLEARAIDEQIESLLVATINDLDGGDMLEVMWSAS